MMMDNYDLWIQHDAEMEERLSRLPVCDECGETIQDEHCYCINGNYICEDCLNDRYRVCVDDIIK